MIANGESFTFTALGGKTFTVTIDSKDTGQLPRAVKGPCTRLPCASESVIELALVSLDPGVKATRRSPSDGLLQRRFDV
jgi:hypothetical protein